MRQKLTKVVFLSSALVASGGWLWLLYLGVRKLI